MALHEQLGPAETSIKAIAEKAGVQRLTVYRHFPDETSLFHACTSHYLELHPPPNMADWTAIQNAGERTRSALLAFYRYYRKTQGMWSVAYRDYEKVKAMQAPMDQFQAYLDQVRDDLLECWKQEQIDSTELAVTLRHCLRFSTWASLRDEKLSDTGIVELVMSWIVK
jgi:AcrR family transcriptional regulator